MIWKYAATAPNGFTHISGSMLGTLLDYIVDGDDFDTIKRKFETNMSAENYRRSQSAPTQRAVESAEKLIEKLGLADSLRRRYAKLVQNHIVSTDRGMQNWMSFLRMSLFGRVKLKIKRK